MKLFSAKCHERATLRKLWRQTGNSSLLTAVTRDGRNLSAGFKFCFCFVLLYNKSLNDWSLGEQWILFPSNVSGNKIHCSPRASHKVFIVIHWTHYLFSDWAKACSKFWKSAPVVKPAPISARNDDPAGVYWINSDLIGFTYGSIGLSTTLGHSYRI